MHAWRIDVAVAVGVFVLAEDWIGCFARTSVVLVSVTEPYVGVELVSVAGGAVVLAAAAVLVVAYVDAEIAPLAVAPPIPSHSKVASPNNLPLPAAYHKLSYHCSHLRPATSFDFSTWLCYWQSVSSSGRWIDAFVSSFAKWIAPMKSVGR